MEPLDGNAIAGELFDHFGVEMTMAVGSCAHCGTCSQIAELSVYGRTPGTVVRCRTCGKVVIVIVNARELTLINLDGFKLRPPPITG